MGWISIEILFQIVEPIPNATHIQKHVFFRNLSFSSMTAMTGRASKSIILFCAMDGKAVFSKALFFFFNRNLIFRTILDLQKFGKTI